MKRFFFALCGFVVLLAFAGVPRPTQATCDEMGWDPDGFGIKDHSIFWFDGYYYLVGINIPSENKFVYGRTQDFCIWEDLSHILEERTNEWENLAIWAPYVYEDNGTYYMFYTGVKGPWPSSQLTQSIMLATSTNPADPDSWISQGMVFQPDHEGMVWEDGQWADCRDPFVTKVEGVYFLYYSGKDVDGNILGVASSTSLNGPWTDQGPIFKTTDPIPESSFLLHQEKNYYLFYTTPYIGEKYRISTTPFGPWSKEHDLKPGWANEFVYIEEIGWLTSYLTSYKVTIKPILWDTNTDPATPYVEGYRFYAYLPLIISE